MKALKSAILASLLMIPFSLAGQVNNPQIIIVTVDPSGATPCNLPWRWNARGSGNTFYPGSPSGSPVTCTWTQLGSGGGGGGNLSGTLTTNSPLYGSAAHTVSSLPTNVFGNVLFDGLGGVPTIVPPYAPFITEPPYNAKCDGSTDDSAAIQAAADANGAIQFPVPTAVSGLIQCNIATGLIQNNPSLVIYGNDDLISYTGSGTGITDNPAGSLTIHNLYFSLANATGTPTELSSSGILLLDFFDDYGDGPAGYTALNYNGFAALVTLINSQPDVAVLAGGNSYSLVNSDFNTSLMVGTPGGNGPAKFNFSNTDIGDVTWNSADVFGNVNITGTQADAPGSGQLCQTLNSINPVCTNFSPTTLLNLPATTKANVVGIDPSTGALTKQAAGGGATLKNTTFVADSTATFVTSPSITIASGDLLVVSCRFGTGSTATATDSQSSVYTALTAQITGGTGLQVSWAIAASSGSTTFTCTQSSSAAGISLVAMDFSGTGTTANTSVGSANSGAAVNLVSPSFTTSQRTVLIQCAAQSNLVLWTFSNMGGAYGEVSGVSASSQFATNADQGCEFRIASHPLTSVTSTIISNTSTSWDTTVLAFNY